MFAISLRLTVSLSLLAVLGWPAAALANHSHIGGSSSGGGSEPDADCLVWGYVVAGVDASADADAADASDAADAAQPADAATDGGSAVPAGARLVCLEHAKLFGCDCAVGPGAGEGWSRGAVALVAVALLAARRRRRATSPGATP